MLPYSDEQSAALQAFMEITQVSDAEESAQLLQRFDWNVDVAVDNYLNTGFRAPAQNDSLPMDVTTPRHTHILTQHTQQELSLVQRFPSFLQPLVAMVNYAGPNSSPESDTRSFLAKYETAYGSTRPAFFEGSFQQAVRHALTSYKFVCIYLHSPLHEDSQEFCTSVLAHPSVIEFFERNVILWGGSVNHREAYQLSMELGQSTYPCVVMLLYRSERDRYLVERIEGVVDSGTFVEKLQNSVAAHSIELRRLQENAARTQEAQVLRQEQDREFTEAMLADQLRREEEQRQVEESRRKLEEERREEQRKAEEEARRIQELEIKRNRLKPEPVAPQPSAVLRIQLPNGAKLERKFSPSDTIQDVRAYVEVYLNDNGIPIVNFSVSTNYPKRTLTDGSETVEAAGLVPRGMLYIQDLDS